MAKTKTYPLGHLAKAARTSARQAAHLIARLGHKPVDVVVIGKRKFRAYDQAAYDAVVAWRAEKDAPKTADPAPQAAPAVSDPGAVFTMMRKIDEVVSKIDVLNTQHRTDRTEIDNGMRYLNTKLDQLIVQVRAISNDLGIGASVLDGLARGPADDGVVRN